MKKYQAHPNPSSHVWFIAFLGWCAVLIAFVLSGGAW